MDNLIKSLLGNTSGDMVEKLQGIGFDTDNAAQFITESGKQAMSVIQSEDVDLTKGSQAGIVDLILSKIDIASLASKVGIDSKMATSGLNAILPSIVGMLSKSDTLSDLSGLAGKAKGLFKSVKDRF